MEEFLATLFANHPILAPLLFIVLRAFAIIIPPIPGWVMDVVAIPTFGWMWGFIYALIGMFLGAVVSFWIARLFREPVVRRITSLKAVHEWESRVSEKKKFWTLVLIRLPTSAIFDYISYAAGLTKISFTKFFFASLIGGAPSLFFLYFFGGLFFQQGVYYYLVVFLGIVATLGLIFGKEHLTKKINKFFESITKS